MSPELQLLIFFLSAQGGHVAAYRLRLLIHRQS